MNTLENIKSIVESKKGMPDIAIRTRKQEYVMARVIYANIAKKYTNRTLADIGALVGVKHEIVLHYAKILHTLTPENKVIYNEVERMFNPDVEELKMSVQDDRDLAFIDLQNKYDELIRKRKGRNEVLRKLEMLEEYHYEQIKHRIETYLKVNKL